MDYYQRPILLTNELNNFLKNAAGQLSEGASWLHAHLDELAHKEHKEIDEKLLFYAMKVAGESKNWDRNIHELSFEIRLADGHGLKKTHPNSIVCALAENKICDEPPSINLSVRDDDGISLRPDIFVVKIEDPRIDMHGLENFEVEYATFPLCPEALSQEWGRSIVMIWRLGE